MPGAAPRELDLRPLQGARGCSRAATAGTDGPTRRQGGFSEYLAIVDAADAQLRAGFEATCAAHAALGVQCHITPETHRVEHGTCPHRVLTAS